MERHEELFVEYGKALDELMEKWTLEGEAARLLGETGGDMSGYIYSKLRKNVADIFKKMFHTSYNNVYDTLKISQLKEFMLENQTQEEQFYSVYMSFFEKISNPWKEKAEKDKLFGKTEEYAKEQVKLSAAAELRTLFNSYYQRFYGGK